MTYREHCQIHYEYDGDWRKKEKRRCRGRA